MTCCFLGREALLRGRGFPRGGDADLVAQLDDDALGGLLADALDFAQRGDVARDDEAAKDDRRDAVEHGERELRPDAADVVDEEEKEVALLRRGEAVEDVGVFADDEMREHFRFRAGLRELVVGRKRDVDVVADAARLDDEAHGQDFNDGAAQEGDHRCEV